MKAAIFKQAVYSNSLSLYLYIYLPLICISINPGHIMAFLQSMWTSGDIFSSKNNFSGLMIIPSRT
jgi:hypothetical protein